MLLVLQRLDGVHLGGFPGGVGAEDHAVGEGDDKGQEDTEGHVTGQLCPCPIMLCLEDRRFPRWQTVSDVTVAVWRASVHDGVLPVLVPPDGYRPSLAGGGWQT